MIPRTLGEWTLEAVNRLLERQVFEDEHFDWKQALWDKRDQAAFERVKKSCVAFANSRGGFLVYGVHDDRGLSAADRLVGLPPELDFAEQFGSAPSACVPSVVWDLLRPSISLPNGRLVHVVEIARSPVGPHCLPNRRKGSGLCFFKRTNKGVEEMSYDEIRLAFADRRRIHSALSILASELEGMRLEAGAVARSRDDAHDTGGISLNVLERAFAEAHEFLPPFEIADLRAIRQAGRRLNTEQQNVHAARLGSVQERPAVYRAKSAARDI